MGAWAEDAFGNDTACDWADEFSEDPSIERVEEAIDSIFDADDYLDSDQASEGLVACEIVARLKGNWGIKNAYSERIDKWVASTKITPSAELVKKTQNAIHRILGENSELQELWDEDGENEKWHGEMNSLLKRVVG
jgi:hypothetical protein